MSGSYIFLASIQMLFLSSLERTTDGQYHLQPCLGRSLSHTFKLPPHPPSLPSTLQLISVVLSPLALPNEAGFPTFLLGCCMFFK